MMEQKRRHEVGITPTGVKAYVTWSALRRALVVHVSVDGRWFSFELKLGDLLVNLRVTEASVIGCLRRALSLRGKDEREEFKAAA